MRLNCVIVDDEPLAIKLMKSFVERTPFLDLKGTFLNPMDALAFIDETINLVFMDINMPGITGLELSKLIRPQTKIIFTTAYKEYAFESYEVQAIDYLLKPISYPKFLSAVTRAKEYFEQIEAAKGASASSAAAAQADGSVDPNAEYIFVKCEYKQVRVDLDQILFISGLKDYSFEESATSFNRIDHDERNRGKIAGEPFLPCPSLLYCSHGQDRECGA